MGSFVKTMQQLQKTAGGKTIFYDAGMLSLYWETKPELIEKVLPKELKPGKKPVVKAFIADYPRTSFCPPYKEAGLFVPAIKDGQEGDYCLSMPITDGQAMAMGREIMGLPKKMADIRISVSGGRFTGSIERNGIVFFKVDAEIGAETNEPPREAELLKTTADGMNIFHVKYTKAPDGSGFDLPPTLYANKLDCQCRVVKPAKVEMELTDSPHDPWAELEPVKLLGGVYSQGDNTLQKGTKLGPLSPMEFLPYTFTRWDWWLGE